MVGWFDLSFNVCVTVYLWSCFALRREDRKVYVMILGDVASPVRRRAKKTMCLVLTSPWSPLYGPWPQTVEQLAGKETENKHLL